MEVAASSTCCTLCTSVSRLAYNFLFTDQAYFSRLKILGFFNNVSLGSFLPHCHSLHYNSEKCPTACCCKCTQYNEFHLIAASLIVCLYHFHGFPSHVLSCISHEPGCHGHAPCGVPLILKTLPPTPHTFILQIFRKPFSHMLEANSL